MNKDKKGIVGVTIITIVAVISIFLLLFVFIISSSFVKSLGRVNSDVGIIEEENLGIRDVPIYVTKEYEDHVEMRLYIKEGRKVNEAIDLSGRREENGFDG